jgi:5'(3')-deoxyribonucleotidase
MKKRIYIDMDNTLCNYSKSYRLAREKEPETQYPQAQYGFFANLEPLPNAIESYHQLRQSFEVYILTAPSHLNPLCYTEKRVWVEKHLGLEITRDLIICKRKGLLKGDFLIDDYPYPEFEGEQLLFGQAPFENWKKVMTYLTQNS